MANRPSGAPRSLATRAASAAALHGAPFANRPWGAHSDLLCPWLGCGDVCQVLRVGLLLLCLCHPSVLRLLSTPRGSQCSLSERRRHCKGTASAACLNGVPLTPYQSAALTEGRECDKAL